MARRLLILGDGSFALETLDIAEAAGGFEAVGFVNSVAKPDTPRTHGGLPVYWVDAVPFGPDDCVVVAGLVSTRRRPLVETMRQRGFKFASIVHPSAVISPRATVGDGCVVNAGAIVSSHTAIAADVVLNRGCLVGHDNRIASFCTIGPGANLAGALDIGAGTYIGVGAVIRDHLAIGAGAVVSAGAVVVSPVAPGTVVTGVPARVVKTGVNGL